MSFEARHSSDSPSIRDALSAIYTAMRSGDDPRASDGSDDPPNFGHDPAFLLSVAPLLEFLYARYFRVRMLGIENVPLSGPALLVANHSGGLPYDGALLIYGIFRNHPSHRRLRTLVANFAFHSSWMSPVVRRIGGVRAASGHAKALLNAGELVGVFPEGLRGVGKLYRERYRLERFGRGGFARLAKETGAPIIPIAIVGAEEIHPVLARWQWLARRLELPYFPVTPTFPWLGLLGLVPLPTKWRIRFGPPLMPVRPYPRTPRDQFLHERAEYVRTEVQRLMDMERLRRNTVIFG